jgi:hypothetical protein
MILILIIKGLIYNTLTILNRLLLLIYLLLIKRKKIIKKIIYNLILNKNKNSLLNKEYKLYIK